MKLVTSLRQAMAVEIIAAIANGTLAAPRIQIYDGALPASMGGAITDTLLAELELSVSVGTASDGVVTFGPISNDPSPPASGTTGWARILDRDGAEVLYIDAAPGGGLTISPGDITAGETVSITSGTITVGQ